MSVRVRAADRPEGKGVPEDMARPVAELRALRPERVCLIKPSALGDVVNALPVLSALRAHWPRARLNTMSISGAERSTAMANRPLPRKSTITRRRFIKGAALTGATFSPTGDWILTGSNDGTARVLNCQVCEPLRQLERLAALRLRRLAR